MTLARAEPVYEDFKKVAETYVCSSCGHRYPSREKTPFVEADGRPKVFVDADKPVAAKVFKADERRRSCAWCRHFITNPFCQRCGLSNREVAATDICGRFSPKPDQPTAVAATSGASTAGSRFDALFGKVTPPVAPVAPVEIVPKVVSADSAPKTSPAPTPSATPAESTPKTAPVVSAPLKVPPKAPLAPPPPLPEPVEVAPKKAPAKKRAVSPAKRVAKDLAAKAPVVKEAAAKARSAKEPAAKKPVGRPRKTVAK